MPKPTCQQCGKPVLPGSRFCSNSCDAGSVMTKKKPAHTDPNPGVAALLSKGVKSVTLKAVEFDPKPDGRGPGPKNKPILWEARVSDDGNGDAVARRKNPDDALSAALSCFGQHKKPVTNAKPPKVEDDDVDSLI